MIGEAVDREREAAERERTEIRKTHAKLAYAEQVARQGHPAGYVLRTLFLYSCFTIVYLSLRVGFDQLGYPWGYPTLAEVVAFGTALFIAGFLTIFMSLVIAGLIARATRRRAT